MPESRVPVYIELAIAYRGIAEAACVVWDAESKKDEKQCQIAIVGAIDNDLFSPRFQLL